MHFLNPATILGACALIVFGAFIFPIPDQILSQVAQTAGGPTFSFLSDSYSVQEGENITIKVKANGPIYQTTRVKLQAQSGTASVRSDFNPLISTVTFYRGGLTTKSVTFKTKKDSLAEGDETATIKIISINGVNTSQAATVTISDAGTTGGTPTVTTCATNEPCDKFDPWRPFSSRSTFASYQVSGGTSFGGGTGSMSPFSPISVSHPKIGSMTITGKFSQPWDYSPVLFAPGNVRTVAVPSANIGIFSLVISSSSATKTWTNNYINDYIVGSGNGIGFPIRVISKIPGDFNPNNIPQVCRFVEAIGYGNMIFSVDPVAKNTSNVCYLRPGEQYYVNYVYALIDYSDMSLPQVRLWQPQRPPTTPMLFEQNGKSARVVETNSCWIDNGSGPVFASTCEQASVFRTVN